MSLEERKALVKNAGERLIRKGRNKPVTSIKKLLCTTFIWYHSDQGDLYWVNIFERFTKEELEQKIDIK